MAGIWLKYNGVVAHVHVPDSRAYWVDSKGQGWWMEFHNYCGPFFSRDPEFADGGVDPPTEIWEKFKGWYKATRDDRAREEDSRPPTAM